MPGEDGDLLAAQARDPPVVSPIHGQPGLRGTDPGPACAQERPDLAADAGPGRSCLPCLPLYERSRLAGGPCQYPSHQGLPPRRAGWFCGQCHRGRRGVRHINQKEVALT